MRRKIDQLGVTSSWDNENEYIPSSMMTIYSVQATLDWTVYDSFIHGDDSAENIHPPRTRTIA